MRESLKDVPAGREGSSPKKSSISLVRIPLLSRVNTPPPQLPQSSPERQIRRRSSFLLRADSSNETPSSHGSIYDAQHTAQSINNDNGRYTDNDTPRISLCEIDRETAISKQKNVSRQQMNSSEILDESPNFLYGHGTLLETIVERRSDGTLRTMPRTTSADDLQSLKTRCSTTFLGSRSSHMSVKSSPQFRRSFSLNDLDLAAVNRPYHDACRDIARDSDAFCASALRQDKSEATILTTPIHEIYASPRTPLMPPPHRPPTPPGMPSWTIRQKPLRQPPTSRKEVLLNRVRNLFGLEPRTDVRSSRQIPSGESVQLPPRILPPRSSYISLQAHPFSNAPVAKVVSSPHPFGSDAQLDGRGEMPRSRIPDRVSSRGGRSSRGHRMGPDGETNTNRLGASARITAMPDERCTIDDPSTFIGRLLSPSKKHEKQKLCSHRQVEVSSGDDPRHEPARATASPAQESCSSPSSPPAPASRIPHPGGIPAPTNPSSEQSSDARHMNVTSDAPPAARENGPDGPTADSTDRCWRCRFADVVQVLETLWLDGLRCCCVVCCGAEMDALADEERAGRYFPVNVRDGVAVRPR